jgi:hypothetical protein
MRRADPKQFFSISHFLRTLSKLAQTRLRFLPDLPAMRRGSSSLGKHLDTGEILPVPAALQQAQNSES